MNPTIPSGAEQAPAAGGQSNTITDVQGEKNLKARVLIGLDGNFEVVTGSYLSDVIARLFTYPFEVRTPGPIGGSPYSLEEIVTIDPDIHFVETYNNADPNAPPLSEVLARNPLWGRLTVASSRAQIQRERQATTRASISMAVARRL